MSVKRGNAFLWFFMSSAAGVAVTLRWPAWAFAVVLLYVLTLRPWALHREGRLNPTTRDSPYFLGFILTLFGLWFLFRSAGSGGAESQSASTIISHAGAAILPTVVGLFGRQWLWASFQDFGPEDQVLAQLARDVSQNATDLLAAQTAFVKVVQGVEDAHKKLLREEIGTFREVIARRRHWNRLLGELEEACSGRLQGLRQVMDEMGREVESQATTLQQRLGAAGNDLVKKANDGATRLSEGAVELDKAIVGARSHVEAAAGDVGGMIEALRGQVADFKDSVGGAMGVLEGLTRHDGEQQGALIRFRTEIERAGGGARELTQVLGAEKQKSQETLRTLSEQTRKDLEEIDQTVTQFVQVLKRHLERWPS